LQRELMRYAGRCNTAKTTYATEIANESSMTDSTPSFAGKTILIRTAAVERIPPPTLQ